MDRNSCEEYLEISLFDSNDELEESRMLLYVEGQGYCTIEYPGMADYKGVLHGYQFKPEEYIPVECYIQRKKDSFKIAKIKNVKGASLVVIYN